MSIKVITWVWEHEFPPHLQSVMLALADHADDDGQYIYPSVAHLVWKTGASERTIRENLKQLRLDGVLDVVRPSAQHRPTEYKIVMDQTRYAEKRPWAEVRGATSAPLEGCVPPCARGAAQRMPEVQPAAPESSLEPSLESKDIPSLSPLTGELRKIVGKGRLRGVTVAIPSMVLRFGEPTVRAAIQRHVTQLATAQNPLTYLEAILRREASEIPSREEERARREQFERGVEEARQARLAREAAYGIDPGRDGEDTTPAGIPGRVGPAAVLVQVRQVSGQRGRDVPQTGRPEREAVGAAVYSLSEGRRDMGGLEAADRAIRRDDGC